jgi:RNA polymerase sigma factor (sigma-70 family)
MEELAHALALWAIIELLPQEGEVGLEARQEVKRLGIDVRAKYQDIKKITLKHFRGSGIDPEDLVQEVMVAILKRNTTKSAFDPSLSAFGHYVYMVAHNVLANALEKQRRYNREVMMVEPLEMVDDRDTIGAFEAVHDSPRISRNRPLDRSKVDTKNAVLN